MANKVSICGFIIDLDEITRIERIDDFDSDGYGVEVYCTTILYMKNEKIIRIKDKLGFPIYNRIMDKLGIEVLI